MLFLSGKLFSTQQIYFCRYRGLKTPDFYVLAGQWTPINLIRLNITLQITLGIFITSRYLTEIRVIFYQNRLTDIGMWISIYIHCFMWDEITYPCHRVYPKKYAHGFCFAVLCCGYSLTDFPISIRLTSLALWQSNDCPSTSKATLMNMDKYFMWIHYERLHNHNKAKHNKTVCIFLGIYCSWTHFDMDGITYPCLNLNNDLVNMCW